MSKPSQQKVMRTRRRATKKQSNKAIMRFILMLRKHNKAVVAVKMTERSVKYKIKNMSKQ